MSIPGVTNAEIQVTTTAITTTDATPTVLYSLEMPPNFVGALFVTITGRQSDGSNRAVYGRSMVIFRAASTPGNDTVRVVGTDYESDAAWDATIARSTNTINATVTGVADTTIDWTARVTLVAG